MKNTLAWLFVGGILLAAGAIIVRPPVAGSVIAAGTTPQTKEPLDISFDGPEYGDHVQMTGWASLVCHNDTCNVLVNVPDSVRGGKVYTLSGARIEKISHYFVVVK